MPKLVETSILYCRKRDANNSGDATVGTPETGTSEDANSRDAGPVENRRDVNNRRDASNRGWDGGNSRYFSRDSWYVNSSKNNNSIWDASNIGHSRVSSNSRGSRIIMGR